MSILAANPAPAPISASSTSSELCQNCGSQLPHGFAITTKDSQRRIEELEAQVRMLTGKATAAVDKLADYEDEIQKLKVAQASQQMPAPQTQRDITSSPTPSEDNQQPQPSRGSGVLSTSTSRLSSFLTSRKSSPALASEAAGHSSPSLPSTEELQKVLSSEKEKRRKAETQLDQANGELEELSASLFMQANEMVAEERRARAKLEERVAVLEKRDGDKRARLEKLENAVERINRVRGLLAP